MKSYDVIVVGSGPGGSTLAREMAMAGKSVCLLEKGRDHKWIGNHIMALDDYGFILLLIRRKQ